MTADAEAAGTMMAERARLGLFCSLEALARA